MPLTSSKMPATSHTARIFSQWFCEKGELKSKITIKKDVRTETYSPWSYE